MDFVMGLCGQVTVLDYGDGDRRRAAGDHQDDPRVLDAYLGAARTDDDLSRAGR